MKLRSATTMQGAWIMICMVCFHASPHAQTLNDPNLTVETIVQSGTLDTPTCMVFLSATDILVGEKNTGQVERVLNGVVQSSPVLDLPVSTSSERGLLGMVLHPLFSSNSYVYIYYSRAASDGGAIIDHTISRFTWDGTNLTNEEMLVTLPGTNGPNHDGGIIVFGPPTAAPADQKLFAIIGDLNRNNQNQNFPAGAAPDDSGVIIRVNADGSTPSGADRGPFFDVAGGNTSLERMYAYGIRNSFGLTFDPVTGNLWDTENGPGDYDEINLVLPTFNSGWEDLMGPEGAPGSDEVNAASRLQFGGVGTYSDPEFSWRQTIAPTAIYFLPITGLGPDYQYDCFVGANNNGKLYHFEPNGSRDGFVLTGSLADLVLDGSIGDNDNAIEFGTNFSVVTDIEAGPDNALYVLSLGFGQIYRIYHPDFVPVELGELILE